MELYEMDSPQPAPTGLGEQGLSLWESITQEFDFSSEPGKLAVLERAAKTADQIAVLEAAVVGADLVVKGSTGQPVVNPMIAEVRQQSGLLNTLLKSLGLPDSDEEAQAKAERRSQINRQNVQKRWARES